MSADSTPKRILVTGASGYVGGKLVPLLVASGHSVRVLVRDARRLKGRAWRDQVDIAEGDVLEPETLPATLAGIDSAYYLIHSMSDSPDFHNFDMMAARNFAQAARSAGVQHIIYLGGLGDPDDQLSPHLRSRHQTGEALREAGVPVTELRAAIIVGSGSVSFEMVRYLTERVPVMVCPRWVYTRIQPIAIRNVLDYLVAVLVKPEVADRMIEIGGADVISYGEMMLGYAAARGLRRVLVPVPVLTPRLSSYWVHWVSPIPAEIARPLIKGLRNEVIVRDPSARNLFPEIVPMGYEKAVKQALARLEAGQVEQAWNEAQVSSLDDIQPVTLTEREGLIIERCQQVLKAPSASVFNVFTRLGGDTGWLYANWAWVLRGVLDQIVGGVGLRRGRRHPEEVRVGDALDFWRVEDVQPGRSLRLRAEMKLPGQAWLQFETVPKAEGETLLTQTIYFAPKGLFGLLYWYVLYPIHSLISRGMIDAIGLRSIAQVASSKNSVYIEH